MSVVAVAILFFTHLLQVAQVSHGLNIEVRDPQMFQNGAEQFGSRVWHFDSSDGKWIIVSEPHKKQSPNDRCGGIFKCINGRAECQSIKFPECTKHNVDLVFLVDSSGSLRNADFINSKSFIIDIMKNMSSTSIQFAAVQFSSDVRTEFNFSRYQAIRDPEKLLTNMQHMMLQTNTHKALNYTIGNLLYNTQYGAKEKATKVLLIITDGDSTDFDKDYDYVTKRLDEKHVIRYAIGVGSVNIKNLKSLASEPKDSNTFYVNDYKGLRRILDNMQDRIYNVEDEKTKCWSFVNEMSQSGFSVAYAKDRLILEAVGTSDRAGSDVEMKPDMKTPIMPPKKKGLGMFNTP